MGWCGRRRLLRCGGGDVEFDAGVGTRGNASRTAVDTGGSAKRIRIERRGARVDAIVEVRGGGGVPHGSPCHVKRPPRGSGGKQAMMAVEEVPSGAECDRWTAEVDRAFRQQNAGAEAWYRPILDEKTRQT